MIVIAGLVYAVAPKKCHKKCQNPSRLRGIGKQKTLSSGLLSVFLCKWCHQESNRGHKDFQSFALPTELWHHCCSFASAKVARIFESTKFSNKKISLFCIFFNFPQFWVLIALLNCNFWRFLPIKKHLLRIVLTDFL